MDVYLDALLNDLQRGEREAFVRYYELYRAPVYALARRLLHDGADAVRATEEAFATAYRQILLHDDGAGLLERTFAAVLEVCGERLSERETDGGTAPGASTGTGRRERSDLGRRFGQALESLPFRSQAALLLHDIDGLRSAELAIVFGVTADAADALLFRAREEFRRAFEGLSTDRRAAQCRLAELTAAGAVGRTLPDEEVRRLDEHAGYCRQCRRTMKDWGGNAVGLALFLEEGPLPQALETTPVFGATMSTIGSSGAPAGSGLLTRIRRSLTSKAAAYALAAACSALAVGLAVNHTPGGVRYIVLQASGPNGARSARQAATVVRTPVTRTSHTGAAPARPAAPSAGSFTSAAAAPETAFTIVADLGGLADGGSPTAGRAGASSAEASQTVPQESDAEAGVKASRDAHGSSDTGHSVNAGDGRDKPAKSHPDQATKPSKEGGTRQAKPAGKDHEAKPAKDDENKKDH